MNKHIPRDGNNRVKHVGSAYRAQRKARAKVAAASRRRNRRP